MLAAVARLCTLQLTLCGKTMHQQHSGNAGSKQGDMTAAVSSSALKLCLIMARGASCSLAYTSKCGCSRVCLYCVLLGSATELC